MRLLISAALSVLAACSQPAEPLPTPAPVPAAGPLAEAPKAEQTVGGDGSPIRLNALSAAEVDEAELPGELGCGFDAGSGALLVAAGDVASREPALGIVKVGDYIERVAAPGGFDGMLRGATFSGKGKTIRIVITGKPTAGGESPPSPATLTYERADGASRTITGEWTCGP